MTWTCPKCDLTFARECAHNCTDNPPTIRAQLWDVATALADFATMPKLCGEDQYRQRLLVCDDCPRRRNRRCLECGCAIDIKAQAVGFQCPLGKWDQGKAV